MSMTAGSQCLRRAERSLVRPLALGLLTRILGLICAALPVFERLETDLGLELMFRLRGPRQPPSEVILVNRDSESSRQLRLANDPELWPPSLHARLLNRLNRKGARVVVFDILFDRPRALRQDRLFTAAIRKAGNVVLFEYLQKEPVIGVNRQVLATR